VQAHCTIQIVFILVRYKAATITATTTIRCDVLRVTLSLRDRALRIDLLAIVRGRLCICGACKGTDWSANQGLI
jgi:hypothetical protein